MGALVDFIILSIYCTIIDLSMDIFFEYAMEINNRMLYFIGILVIFIATIALFAFIFMM